MSALAKVVVYDLNRYGPRGEVSDIMAGRHYTRCCENVVKRCRVVRATMGSSQEEYGTDATFKVGYALGKNECLTGTKRAINVKESSKGRSRATTSSD